MGLCKLISKFKQSISRHHLSARFKKRPDHSPEVITADNTPNSPVLDSEEVHMDSSPDLTTAGSASTHAVAVGVPISRPQAQNTETGSFENFCEIHGVPRYIDIGALKKFAATLPHLQIVLRHPTIDDSGKCQFFFKFQIPCCSNPELPTSVIIDGHPLTLYKLWPNGPSEFDASAVPFLIKDGSQNVDLAPNCSTFTYIENSLPKGKCHYCHELLTEDGHTPCLDCSWQVCRGCLKRRFEVALKDHECMPVQCCGEVIHPDVTTGILDDTQRARYKDRFEKMYTKKPFYCAGPTCSVFIPPRKLKITNDEVLCPECNTKTCAKCGYEALDDHNCEECKAKDKAWLDKYGYKRCPDCGAAQAKMFGCNHMRCVCGTHWCWECDVVVAMCGCITWGVRAAHIDSDDTVWGDSDDDNEEDDDDDVGSIDTPMLSIDEDPKGSQDLDDSHPELSMSEADNAHDEDNAQNSTSDVTAIASMTDTTIAPLSDDDVLPDAQSYSGEDDDDDNDEEEGGGDMAWNLDSERVDWGATNLDFGADPGATLKGIKMCRHSFVELDRQCIPKFWMAHLGASWWHPDADGTWERSLECMLCRREMKIPLPDVAVASEKLASHRCIRCGILCCGGCKTRILQRRVRLGTASSSGGSDVGEA